MKRNPPNNPKLACVTSEPNSNSSAEARSSSDTKSNSKSAGHSPAELSKSPKKSSKHLDSRSPTKKSIDYLSKKAAEQETTDLSKGDSSTPGIRKFTRDISDVAGKRLPKIVSLFLFNQ